MPPNANKSSEKELLLKKKAKIIDDYRQAVKWSCVVLDYKRKFEREEDFGTDNIQDWITILKNDSRRELKNVATNIKIMRDEIDKIDKRLMDMATEDKGDK